MSFLKRRWLWVMLAVIALGGGWWLRQRAASAGPFYETRLVRRGDVVRTVEVTGQVKPAERVDLSFKASGQVVYLPVKVGDKVVEGDVLAELDARDLEYAVTRARAALATARANLNARLAGETAETIRIAEASVTQARAAKDKAVSDLEITRQTVEDEYRVATIAVETARDNLQNSGSSLDQTATNRTETLRQSLITSLGSMRTALTEGDAIIGVDDTAANDAYEGVLGINDRPALERAKTIYPTARTLQRTAESSVQSLTALSSSTEVRRAALNVQSALSNVQTYLDEVQRTLAGTIPNITLTDTLLTTKKSAIDADRSAVSTQAAAVTSAFQAAVDADLSRTTTRSQLEHALTTAQTNLDIADHNRTTKVRTAETNVEIQSAALVSAEAGLALKKAKPREVDIAALRAQVTDAEASYAQALDRLSDAQIVAPVDGTVSEILPSLGEQTAALTTVVSMVAARAFTIEALVPEADIPKIEVGQAVSLTLDAYGERQKFTAMLVSINPDQTKVQDAVYYKVQVTLNAEEDKLKPGMTANLTIKTGERTGVLILPTRALRDENERQTVRVLEAGNATKTLEVKTGLRGDEGNVEALEGITEGQAVIVGELTAAEYKTWKAEQK